MRFAHGRVAKLAGVRAGDSHEEHSAFELL